MMSECHSQDDVSTSLMVSLLLCVILSMFGGGGDACGCACACACVHACRCVSVCLFHHQTSTCIENVKFWEVNVDLLPGTSSGK